MNADERIVEDSFLVLILVGPGVLRLFYAKLRRNCNTDLNAKEFIKDNLIG